MGFFLHLAILNLGVLVVCGVPQWFVVPGVVPLVPLLPHAPILPPVFNFKQAGQARIHCDHWCENPAVSGSYMCCEDIDTDPTTNAPLVCPADTRPHGTCTAPGAYAGVIRLRCYYDSDCDSDLKCCYDACLGQTCKKTIQKQVISPPPITVGYPLVPSAKP